jgi:hypothetical protein
MMSVWHLLAAWHPVRLLYWMVRGVLRGRLFAPRLSGKIRRMVGLRRVARPLWFTWPMMVGRRFAAMVVAGRIPEKIEIRGLTFPEISYTM